MQIVWIRAVTIRASTERQLWPIAMSCDCMRPYEKW